MVKRGQQSEHSSDKRARSMENLQDFLDTEKLSLVKSLKGRKASSLSFVFQQVRKSEPFAELQEAIFNLHWKKQVTK